MTALVRAELLKLRSTRVPGILLATALVMVALYLAVVLLSPPEAFDLSGAKRIVSLVEGAVIAQLFAFGVGVVMLAGEFRHGTIRQTLLTTPARGRVLAAKLLVAVPVGLVLAVVVLTLPLAIGVPWLLLDGVAVDPADPELLLVLLGQGAALVLVVPLGVALAALLRLQSLTVIVFFLWTGLGEFLIDFFFSGATPYLPNEALYALARSDLGRAVDPVPMWTGALLVVGYVAVLALLGKQLTLRRDIP
jgi:ABC-2 type transport system permease protein